MRTAARVAMIALLTVGAARAQDACKPDVDKLCAGIPAGGGRILSCLKANSAKVSPDCKTELAAIKKKAQAIGDACQGDVYEYCPSVEPGKGAVLKCLSSNSANLTPACQKVVYKAEEGEAAFKQACGADVKKFCKGIPQGQGRILSCLKSKQTDLSPDCAAMFSSQ